MSHADLKNLWQIKEEFEQQLSNLRRDARALVDRVIEFEKTTLIDYLGWQPELEQLRRTLEESK